MSQRLLRVIRMVELIRKQRYPSVERLCELFDIKKRTVHEDISFIKQELRLDIRHDRYKGGYYDANPSQELPKIDLTDSEFFLLQLSSEAFSKQNNQYFEPILESALNKIEEQICHKDKTPTNRTKLGISFQHNASKSFSFKLFTNLHNACAEQFLVSIAYEAATGNLTNRQIEPYRLLSRNSNWYLVAYCYLRNGPRLFALQRVQDSQIHSQRFSLRPDFDVDNWLNLAFQIEHGDDSQQVKILFNSKTARYIREKRWHPNQECSDNNDGSCVLILPTQSLAEIKRWVLYYGKEAEVLEPLVLRNMLKAEAEALLSKYR